MTTWALDPSAACCWAVHSSDVASLWYEKRTGCPEEDESKRLASSSKTSFKASASCAHSRSSVSVKTRPTLQK